MSIGRTVVKEVEGLKVTCHELTVAELRGVLARKSSDDLLSEGLFRDVALADLHLFTSLTQEQIEAYKPSELSEVISGCREANPDFFDLLARLSKAGTPS